MMVAAQSCRLRSKRANPREGCTFRRQPVNDPITGTVYHICRHLNRVRGCVPAWVHGEHFVQKNLCVKGFAVQDGAGGGNIDKPYRHKFCKPYGARGGTRPARCGDRNVAEQRKKELWHGIGVRVRMQYYMGNLHMAFPRDRWPRLGCARTGCMPNKRPTGARH